MSLKCVREWSCELMTFARFSPSFLHACWHLKRTIMLSSWLILQEKHRQFPACSVHWGRKLQPRTWPRCLLNPSFIRQFSRNFIASHHSICWGDTICSVLNVQWNALCAKTSLLPRNELTARPQEYLNYYIRKFFVFQLHKQDPLTDIWPTIETVT